MKISDQDRKLLREVQSDATVSLAVLAQRIGMAPSTLWRRLNELEKVGVITGRVALLDPTKVDAKLCVLAQVTLEDHTESAIQSFTSMVTSRPEILECHKVSGMADYVLKIRASDVEDYENFQSRFLLRNKSVRSVHSSFVLKEVKSTTALPV